MLCVFRSMWCFLDPMDRYDFDGLERNSWNFLSILVLVSMIYEDYRYMISWLD